MKAATLQWEYYLAKAEFRLAANGYGCKSKTMAAMNVARAAYHRALYGAPERYEDAIPISIRGIPASFHVEIYRPAVDERVFGVHPDHAMPGEPAVVTGLICDRKGYRARWLDCMADMDDVERQVLEFLRKE